MELLLAPRHGGGSVMVGELLCSTSKQDVLKQHLRPLGGRPEFWPRWVSQRDNNQLV